MRGMAAHSNGFHAIRALTILMSILGTIDRPGGFRHKAPFPRPIPPCAKTPNGPEGIRPETPLGDMPLGWPEEPDDLFVDDEGEAIRIDKAFSWEYPLSVHGMMHNVITNATRGDPYHLDTLMIFMNDMRAFSLPLLFISLHFFCLTFLSSFNFIDFITSFNISYPLRFFFIIINFRVITINY